MFPYENISRPYGQCRRPFKKALRAENKALRAALLGPKGGPFRPKIKKNMKNEKPSKTVREKRFSGSESRK